MSADAVNADAVSADAVNADELPAASLFADVVGQEASIATLRAAAARPVHAYLLLGHAGAGPRAALRGFAAALLCPRGGCGTCDACRRSLAETHPDLVVAERTGAALEVGDARRLATLALRRPLEAARQVLVVPDAHLALRSAPALLKTLEEPPPTTVFVLLAEDVPPDLVTVASRCLEVPFPPVPAGAIATWLVARGVEEERASLIADGASGDVDRARLLAEDTELAQRQALWRSVPERIGGDGASAAELARELLAAIERGLAPLRALHDGELEGLEHAARAAGERGVPGRKEVLDRHRRAERRWRTDELRFGLGAVARAYRDRMAAAVAAPGAGAGVLVGDRGSEARGAAAAAMHVTEAARTLRRNANETLLLEALFVRLGREDP